MYHSMRACTRLNHRARGTHIPQIRRSGRAGAKQASAPTCTYLEKKRASGRTRTHLKSLELIEEEVHSHLNSSMQKWTRSSSISRPLVAGSIGREEEKGKGKGGEEEEEGEVEGEAEGEGGEEEEGKSETQRHA